MTNRDKVLWITRTALLLALLIVLQMATSFFGNTLVTGSIVNLVLILSVMTSGLASGLTIAMVSPVVAKLLGIGPLWGLIPFIMAGNAVLVLLWRLIGRLPMGRPVVSYLVATAVAAIGKFLVLYLGIVRIAIPFLLKLPGPQAAVISGMFSYPQLVTALLGGVLALAILPAVNKAVGARPRNTSNQ